MIEDPVTQNLAPAGSRHRIEPLLSVSYTANSGIKTEALMVKILPDYAHYASVIKPLAGSDPIHIQPPLTLTFTNFG